MISSSGPEIFELEPQSWYCESCRLEGIVHLPRGIGLGVAMIEIDDNHQSASPACHRRSGTHNIQVRAESCTDQEWTQITTDRQTLCGFPILVVDTLRAEGIKLIHLGKPLGL